MSLPRSALNGVQKGIDYGAGLIVAAYFAGCIVGAICTWALMS